MTEQDRNWRDFVEAWRELTPRQRVIWRCVLKADRRGFGWLPLAAIGSFVSTLTDPQEVYLWLALGAAAALPLAITAAAGV